MNDENGSMLTAERLNSAAIGFAAMESAMRSMKLIIASKKEK